MKMLTLRVFDHSLFRFWALKIYTRGKRSSIRRKNDSPKCPVLKIIPSKAFWGCSGVWWRRKAKRRLLWFKHSNQIKYRIFANRRVSRLEVRFEYKRGKQAEKINRSVARIEARKYFLKGFFMSISCKIMILWQWFILIYKHKKFGL